MLTQSGILPGITFPLDVWAYTADQYATVMDRARQTKQDTIAGRKSGVMVAYGELLTVRLELSEGIIANPVETLTWNGVPTNATFHVSIPANREPRALTGTAVIASQGIPIARISFLLPMTEGSKPCYADYSTARTYPRTAFASYCSEDREEVLSRIQGMKKVAPQLDVFLDVMSLRSGDDWQAQLEQQVPAKDTFYLFWSKLASQSEWVEREWRLALTRRGIRYIDPVPLEDPRIAPPPFELRVLHFGDPYLMLRSYEQIKSHLAAPP